MSNDDSKPGPIDQFDRTVTDVDGKPLTVDLCELAHKFDTVGKYDEHADCCPRCGHGQIRLTIGGIYDVPLQADGYDMGEGKRDDTISEDAYCPRCGWKRDGILMIPDWREELVMQHPDNCPFCGSDQIEGGPVEIEGIFAIQEMGCTGEEHEWTMSYLLNGATMTEPKPATGTEEG